jgi:hypothetical protein
MKEIEIGEVFLLRTGTFPALVQVQRDDTGRLYIKYVEAK